MNCNLNDKGYKPIKYLSMDMLWLKKITVCPLGTVCWFAIDRLTWIHYFTVTDKLLDIFPIVYKPTNYESFVIIIQTCQTPPLLVWFNILLWWKHFQIVSKKSKNYRQHEQVSKHVLQNIKGVWILVIQYRYF